ncbi:MAG: integrase [Hirschia sp.]|nr:integrase [Hirschia sp.]MBF16872.1 integrase [Hirschia sp.]
MALSDIQLKNLKPEGKPYRKADGGGLFVEMRPNGSKLWRLAYRYDHKQKLMALGSYPETSLQKAREKRQLIKALLQDGVDPMAKAKADESERRALAEHTFANIADELLAKRRKDGLAETTLRKKARLIGMAKADFGNRPIADITAAEILATLRKPEAAGNFETAKRLRTAIGEVFRYAVATARAELDPTQSLRGALVAPKVQHYAAATTKDDFSRVVKAVWAYDSGGPVIQSALKLLVLLYPRPGELRLSHWDEFDLAAGIWTRPAERMKMRREHKKPLPPCAIELLKSLVEFTGPSGLVFKSLYARGRPISENTMNQALRRMGFDKNEATSHGFRSSASSLLNESGKWNPDAIEVELAHVGADQVRKAYHRSMYWKERVEMANWWAEYILHIST